MKIRTLSQLKSLKNRRVLLRVDFNVPLGEGGSIDADADARIRAVLPTIERLRKAKARIVIVSHLGRPKGRQKKLSLEPVAAHLGTLLGQSVVFVADDIMKKPDTVAAKLGPLEEGGVAMLENIRFYPEEEKNDPKLAKRLASLADVFVNDAFAAAHRAHASTAGVTKHLCSYAGLLMAEELKNLSKLIEKPKKPYVVIIGGAKISTKLPTIRKLLPLADAMLLGGAMANNFFKAMGYEIGRSMSSIEEVKIAKRLLSRKNICLPVDVVVSGSPKGKPRVCSPTEIRKNEAVYDIGPETMRMWAEVIKGARTIVWNGPLGLFEQKSFSHGSLTIGRVVAARSKGSAFGVAGGGETLQCIERTGMAEWIDHVSTGGGAMLEFLSGKPLPGVKPLLEKSK